MNATAEQHPPTPWYPLWVRLVAALLRLGFRPLFFGLRVNSIIMAMVRQVPGLALEEVEESPGFYIWISALAAIVVLGLYSLAVSVVLGMEILEFSIHIPWATLVSSYTWLVVAGSGLCIINALGSVFGMHRYETMTKRIVFLSLTSILFGLLYILLHLGRPERVPIYNAISPNVHSAIAWMGALYSVYLIIVIVEFWLLIRPDVARRAEGAEGLKRTLYGLLALKKQDDPYLGPVLNDTRIGRIIYHPRLDRFLDDPRLPRLIGTLAFVIGVAALTMLGSVFAHTESRALWYGPYYPAYFVISALFCGFAFLLAFTIIPYGAKGEEMSPELRALMFEMAQALGLLLAIGFALTAYRVLTSLYDPARQAPVMVLLSGPLKLDFWVFEVGVMSVVPAFVLLWSADKKNLGGVLFGSLLVLVGAFVMRYNFVVGGEVYPSIRGEAVPSFLPTPMEALLIVGVFAGFLLVYSLGEKFLPLREEGAHQAV